MENQMRTEFDQNWNPQMQQKDEEIRILRIKIKEMEKLSHDQPSIESLLLHNSSLEQSNFALLQEVENLNLKVA